MNCFNLVQVAPISTGISRQWKPDVKWRAEKEKTKTWLFCETLIFLAFFSEKDHVRYNNTGLLQNNRQFGMVETDCRHNVGIVFGRNVPPFLVCWTQLCKFKRMIIAFFLGNGPLPCSMRSCSFCLQCCMNVVHENITVIV